MCSFRYSAGRSAVLSVMILNISFSLSSLYRFLMVLPAKSLLRNASAQTPPQGLLAIYHKSKHMSNAISRSTPYHLAVYCGSNISVVKAPSSLLRRRYPW